MLHTIRRATTVTCGLTAGTSLLLVILAATPSATPARTGRLVGTYHAPHTISTTEAYVIVVNDAGRIDDSTSAKPGRPFVFESIPEGEKFVVVIPQGGNAVPAFVDAFVVSADETQVKVTLDAGQPVNGLVMDTSGNGLRGISIRATMKLGYSVPRRQEGTFSGVVFAASPPSESDSPARALSNDMWEFDVDEGELTREVYLDREGRFNIDGFGPMPVQVSVRYRAENLIEQWVLPGIEAVIAAAK